MILTRDFFNVCRTAIQTSVWKGKDSLKVSRVLQELETLEEHNEEAKGNNPHDLRTQESERSSDDNSIVYDEIG